MPNYVNGNAEYQVGQTTPAEKPAERGDRNRDWGRRPRGLLDKLVGGHRRHHHGNWRGGRGKGAILDGGSQTPTNPTPSVPSNV
jgi:hypothetical protein